MSQFQISKLNLLPMRFQEPGAAEPVGEVGAADPEGVTGAAEPDG